MHRIPPSQKIGKKIDEVLRQGLDGEEDVTTAIIRLGVERLVQELLEQEATDYLERGHYQRRQPEQEYRGYRNGYEPRRMRTAEGEVTVQVPQVRDAPETYRSRLMTDLSGRSDVLERLAVEMYARGLSTRDIEDALREASVAYLRCPAVHHKRIQTTNLLERSFLEERRRTKVIPRLFTEKSCLKPAFVSLWRASQRWQGVKMAEIERQQLRLVRHELGLLVDEQDAAPEAHGMTHADLNTGRAGLDPSADPTIRQ